MVTVGIPDPAHETLVAGETSSDGEYISTGSSVVETETKWLVDKSEVIVSDDTVAGVVLDDSVSEFTFVDEGEVFGSWEDLG